MLAVDDFPFDVGVDAARIRKMLEERHETAAGIRGKECARDHLVVCEQDGLAAGETAQFLDGVVADFHRERQRAGEVHLFTLDTGMETYAHRVCRRHEWCQRSLRP